MEATGTAGKKGPGIRSDCHVTITLRNSGGLDIQIKSKVKTVFGKSIEALSLDVLKKIGIENARVEIEDQGALPYVIAARLEAAAKRTGKLKKDSEYLLPFNSGALYGTSRNRFRRSRLYLPGNEPKFFINAGLHKPDGIILDLEDSVAPPEKDAARLLVRNALRSVDFYGVERMVRINQLPEGMKDLETVIPHNVHVILVPKCESADQVREIDEAIQRISAKHDLEKDVFLMPIIESALGVIRAYEIASASSAVVALAMGLEDYTADIGCKRTKEGRESFVARSQVVNAARAAGVAPIDTVFSDVGDMGGLRESVFEAKSMGFTGKGCIHPRQIPVVHEAFAPSKDEIEKACRIVKAFEKAEAEGIGVISIGTKMIDPPVVKRAVDTVRMAESMELLSTDWRELQENDR